MRVFARFLSLAILLAAPGCIPPGAPVRPGNTTSALPADSAMAAARTHMANGCYDCLRDARNILLRERQAGDTPALRQLLFEIEVLIASRERDIGISADSAEARAMALAGALPLTLDAPRVLQILRALPPDEFSLTSSEEDSARARLVAFEPERLAVRNWLDSSSYSPLFRDYMIVSLECSGIAGPPLRLPAQRVYGDGPAPLIDFRRAICGMFDATALERVLRVVPRFVEAEYFLAQIELSAAERTGGSRTQAQLQRVHSRFPASAGAAYLLGLLGRATDDCERALAYFDAAIMLRRALEPAHMGRIACLTNLKRNALAVAAATSTIALRTRAVHGAWYWRAVNQRALGDLAAARLDIDTAKSYQSDAQSLTISGIIAFEQNDYNLAEMDLLQATRLPGGDQNCTAAFFLGRVYVSFERWSDAARWFERSMNCCDLESAVIRDTMEKTRIEPDIEPMYRARRLARFEQALTENRAQQYASAFNAANYYFRGGNVTRARELVDVAARDTTLAEQVARLRAAMGGEE